MIGEDLLQPPTTAVRIEKEFRPSFKAIGDDTYELTSISEDYTEAIAELRELGVDVPEGFVPRLVSASHDPAAWHRDAPGEDAVTRPIVRRKWVFDFSGSASAVKQERLVEWVLERTATPMPQPASTGVGAYVVAPSDLQLGGVGSRGGTKETVERTLERHELSLRAAREARPKEIVVLDPGDVTENIENVASQAFTNDLSLPEQFDLANALFTRMLTDYAEIAPVRAAFVPSNHCQLRKNGKNIGKPTDDWGISNARQLARTFKAAGRDDIQIVIPETYSESLAIEVDGLTIGLVHGHQVNNPDRLATWWAGQSFGNGPTAAARLLVVGHFHHWRVQTAGDGKVIVVCPTLDNGSDWFTNLRGEDSKPGLLSFTVTAGLFDHMRIL